MLKGLFGKNKFTSYNKVLCFLITLFNIFPLSLTELQCRNQGDCNDRKNINCGICIKNSIETGKCIFPFSYIFQDSSKCERVSVCEENCNSHGNCITMPFTEFKLTATYIPMCVCTAGFYGRICEHSSSHILPYKIGIEFPGIQNPFEIKTRLIFIVRIEVLSVPYRSTAWTIKTVTNDEQYYDKSRSISRWSSSTVDHGYSWPFKTRFSYKPFKREKKYQFLQFGDVVLGYLSSMWLEITSSEAVNSYQYNYAVFISYQETNLICVPVVKLSGCSPRWNKGHVFDRSNHIKISSNVIYIDNGRYVSTSKNKPECKKNANYVWKIWEGDSTNPVLQYSEIRSVLLNPFSLNFATYKVLLEVTSVQEKPSQNFAYCYFTVRFSPLVAAIYGGSERTVTKSYGLILSTSRSLDPNMPPDNQGHMKASWSCVDVSNNKNEICAPFLTLPVSNEYVVPSEKLSYGSVYNITLKVWTNRYDSCTSCGHTGPVFDHATITVSNKTDEVEDNISIECLLNCEKKVVHTQQLFLKVKFRTESRKNHYEFKWTYYEKGETTERDTKDITVEGLPSFMFLVKEKALTSGKSYIFVVRLVNKEWSAKLDVETQEVEFDGNCSITPNAGIKGLSLFEIHCENYIGYPTYEFYDKTLEETEAGLVFSGRMLGSSENSDVAEFKYFRVTRGQVLVYIIDRSGLYAEKQFKVELSPWNVTEEVLEQIFLNLTELLNQGESEQMLELISSVPDIIPLEMDKNEVFKKLLYFTTLAPTDTIANVKLTTSTLTNVLITLNKPTQLSIKADLMRDTLHFVRNQTNILGKILREGTDLKGMSPQEIKLVTTYQLNCLHAVMMCKDPRTVGVTEFDYDLNTLDELMDSSNFAEESIYLIKDILTFLQTPGQPPTSISAAENSYMLWVMENDEEYNVTNYLSKYEEIPIAVSNELIKELATDVKENRGEFAVRVAVLDEDIFWWAKSDIKSNLVSVSLAGNSKSNLSRITFVKNFLDMKINLTPGLNVTQIQGFVMPYNDSKTECTLEKDLTIKIHRLDPEPLSRVSLKFLFPQTNGSLLVLVEKSYRPECVAMGKKAITINEQYPTYPPIISYKEEPAFYYVGILPKANESVKYTFELSTTVCKVWAKGQWSSKGCQISHKTENLTAHCECAHFSMFGAAFPVPPQEIDLFSDVKLFLTVFDNPIVVSFVSIVLIIYFICCFWAWHKDKKDKPLKNVIVLDDNFPGDSFPYLLAVYTSSRFNAGTTAHVGIRIKGDLASSRSHILSSRERKVLKRNYDDWFLLYCSEPLGELQSIHLWHDNSGPSPDWFCDRVIVYDLKFNTEIVFVVEQWIALRLTFFPEASVQGASVSQVFNVKRIFLDNCVLGLREGHTLLCILLRHPRSEISRLQRINVLMCCLMSSMLCSIMFYSPQIDDHEYSVGLRDFYISVQSLVISLITTGVVLFVFKRSNAYTHSKRQSTSQFGEIGSKLLEEKTNSDKSVYSNYVQFVSKTMKGNPLIPAQLEHSEPVVIVRKTWRIVAWTLCMGVIITCSFFIMLYGLKLGLVKSKIWLSSVLFTLSEDFFISTPAKIIFFSILLSMAFQQMCEIDNHRVSMKDILKAKPQTNEDQIEKLLTKRRHQMYAPLRSDVKNEMLKKKELWNNWWTVIDFTVALCFIFVVSAVVFELWSSHYYNNSCVKAIMIKSTKSVKFYAFRNISQVDRFLEESVLRSLYLTFWYNESPIKEKDVDREYWAEDFTHTIVGHQRYRQLRVSPTACTFTFINTTRKCIPHYNGATEDKGDYGSRWQPAQWYDIKQPNSVWKYSDQVGSRFSTLYRLRGESGMVFHNGGYLTDLGPTKQIADSKAHEIVVNNWQDQLTRAVFVEFTLYNINMDLFSQVTLIIEYLTSGTMQLKAQVVSVESKMKVGFWNALFVIFVVYYAIRTGYLINRQGLLEYLTTSSRNRSRIVVVLLGALSISVAAIHFLSSTAYYEHFINHGYGDTYFDFDRFVYYFIYLQDILYLLLAVAIFRTLMIFRGGRTLLNYFYAFTVSIRWIVWITVIICLFLLVQVLLILLLNIFSFYRIEEMVINLRFTKYFKSQSSELKYLKVFLCIKCAVVKFLLCFYILMFMYYYRIARTYRIKKSDQFNIISFVFDKVTTNKRRK